MAAPGGPQREVVAETVRDFLNRQPQVSIIIVNHRSEKVLPDCLQAIAAGDYDFAVEIIIINNPPIETDQAIEIPGKLTIKQIDTTSRVGFGAASNLGVSHAEGEFILLLNPDVILDSSAIRELYTALTEKAGMDIAVGRLIGPDGQFQASCRRFPTLSNLFLSRGSLLHRLFHTGDRSYTLPDYTEVTKVEAAAAAMMMMPRAIFDKLNGFDESFFLYMEDTDLCYRVAQKRFNIGYVPQAGGKHYWGFSTGHYRFRRIIWHHRSLWRYFVKHHRSLPVLICLGPLLLVNCFLSLVAELVTLRK